MAPADPQGPIGVHRLSLALTAIVAQIRQAPDQGSRRRTSARRSAPAAGSFRARGEKIRCGNAWRDHGSSGTIRPTSGRRRSAKIVEKEKPDCEATDFHIVLEPSPIEPNKMNKSIVRPDPNPHACLASRSFQTFAATQPAARARRRARMSHPTLSAKVAPGK